MTEQTETLSVQAAYRDASCGPLRCQRAGCRDQWPAAQPEDAWHNA